jgi:hypothetical protein
MTGISAFRVLDIVGAGLPNVRDDEDVARTLAARDQAHRDSAEDILGACEALAKAGALSDRRWRAVAHLTYARFVYVRHIAPHEDQLTFAEIAARLNRIGVPRFRGVSPWSQSAVSDIRKTVAAMAEGEISLPSAR